MSNPQDQLINFALTELNKVLQNLKQGKEPEMTASMQKIADELERVNDKKSNMTETEVKDFAEKLVKEISDLEE